MVEGKLCPNRLATAATAGEGRQQMSLHFSSEEAGLPKSGCSCRVDPHALGVTAAFMEGSGRDLQLTASVTER